MKIIKNQYHTFVTVILILFISMGSSFASDHRLTKEEFLNKIEKGTISLERAPVISLPANIQSKTLDAQKKAFPGFKDEMWFVHYVKDNKFIYSLFWEWPTNRCLLRIEELDEKLGKPNEKTLDPSGQSVEKKYCDKVYGIKL